MMDFQLDGCGLGGVVGGVAKCLATVDCTTDIRYCSSLGAAFCAVSVVSTCVDLLSFVFQQPLVLKQVLRSA